MNEQQLIDTLLIQKLDEKRNPKAHVQCLYCPNKAVYNQPEKLSGNIIDVCDKHFTYKYFN